MTTATIKYTGNLHTEAVHTGSGANLSTDAPKDNNGNGETFSPTDLTAVSLATCMLTIMGIAARKKEIPFSEAEASVIKSMANSPRRLKSLEIRIQIKNESYSDEEKNMLQKAAAECPVALSLHPDIDQNISFEYY